MYRIVNTSAHFRKEIYGGRRKADKERERETERDVKKIYKKKTRDWQTSKECPLMTMKDEHHQKGRTQEDKEMMINLLSFVVSCNFLLHLELGDRERERGRARLGSVE